MRRFPWLLIAAFFALYVIWGSTYLAIRIGVESWPPLLLAGVRFSLAGSILFIVLRLLDFAAPTPKQWANCFILGFLLLACGNGGVSLAQNMGVASGVAALAVATVPLFTLLFGLFWGQRARGVEWAGIALGLIGIGFLNAGGNLQGSPQGAALLLLAAAAWAFGSVWSRSLDLPKGGMIAAAQMLSAGVILLLASPALGERLEQVPTLSGWLALGYLVVFGSLIAFSAYLYLLQNVRPAAATSYAYVNPLVAVLLGVGFAGEEIFWEEAVAMLVIVASVILVSLPQWRRR